MTRQTSLSILNTSSTNCHHIITITDLTIKLERQKAGGRGQEDQFDGDSTPTNCGHRTDGGVLNPMAEESDSAEIFAQTELPPA